VEANFRWVPVTALAPVAWGTTYFVTHRYLPANHPLYGAAIRALPAGLLLLLVRRRRPRGSWWWKSLVLGSLNMGAFFALVYLAAQALPTSIASTIMATSPVVIMVFAWAALSERPRAGQIAGAGVGIGGVCLMLLQHGGDPVAVTGVVASIAAMTMSSLGYVLTKKWSADVDVLSITSWQLIAGGIVLAPVAAAVEGRPPALDASAMLAFGYVTVVATALAFTAWFTGLRHLDAATVGLIGLLNPVTGVLLGTLVAGESLSVRQICGLLLVFLGILLGQPILIRGGRVPSRGRRPPGRRPRPPVHLSRCVSDGGEDRMDSVVMADQPQVEDDHQRSEHGNDAESSCQCCPFEVLQDKRAQGFHHVRDRVAGGGEFHRPGQQVAGHEVRCEEQQREEHQPTGVGRRGTACLERDELHEASEDHGP
jgi:probable blue pigment (indigoidine) exporter